MSVIFSVFGFFVLLNLLLKKVVHANYSFRPANSTCVWTERQLRKVIEKASNKTRTRITLCRQKILISNTRNPDTYTGIDLTDRFVDLRCYLKANVGKCILDGQGTSRIFHGRRTDFTVRNVNFINSKPEDCSHGGAIVVETSQIKVTGCSFMNNGYNCDDYIRGGALTVYDSTLTINGGSKNRPVRFSDNEANNGGAVSAYDSEVSIDGYTVFSNNSGDFGGAVYLTDSTANIKNVKFEQNYAKWRAILDSSSTHMTMKNVEFIENSSDISYSFNSSLHATNCTFSYQYNTVLRVEKSKITLKSVTFSNTTDTGHGTNIDISDDDNPLFNGSFVKCESNVVFCDGLDESSIYELSLDETSGDFNNTDCKTKGVKGIAGQGSCPI